MSRMARRTRARRLIAAVDGRSRAASRLRLPFDKKSQRRKKKRTKDWTRAGSGHYPGFCGSLLGETAHGFPALFADLGSHGSPRCQDPFCGFLSSFAGNLEVG